MELQGIRVHASVFNVNNAIDPQEAGRDTTSASNDKAETARKIIRDYLYDKVPEFRRLSEFRKKGWENPQGDRFFENQRRNADHADDRTAHRFYKMMKEIGDDMHRITHVFQIKSSTPDEQHILDMCMAPGGFLATALAYNPEARALGFSLPTVEGGHNVLLPQHSKVELRFLDVTMLAEDMGQSIIPHEHPDVGKSLPIQFGPGQMFDLILCDGQVLRLHDRAAYRERKEARRLTVTQLALALDHIKPGGTMIVLLHKVESPETVHLLYTFHKFASVQLYKHTKFHAKRSSFYMLATNVRANCEEATVAIEKWKRIWKIATFGADDDYYKAIYENISDVGVILEDFGSELIQLGREIWGIQANALEKAPFMRTGL